MNKSRHPNLPSISTLLTLPSSPPSPPRIIVVEEEEGKQQQQQEQDNNNLLLSSPRYLQSNNNNVLKSPNHYHDRLSVTLSPMLSPIDSYASSVNSLSPSSFQPPSPLPSPAILSLPSNHTLPPLQGDDPPRRLTRHPSISSITSPKPTYNSLWTSSAPSSPNPQQQQHTREYSPSQHSYCSASSPPPPSSPMSVDQQTSRSPSPAPATTTTTTTTERLPLPPSTQIVLSESGQPILKRRRGRPPSMRESALEGGWTFLTPTVWDVNHSTTTTPPAQDTTQQQQQQTTTTCTPATTIATVDSVMNGSMAAFTSSNMDMVLQMPRKKRGRKPKTHIVGNSCFVWKDITASRRSTKVIKEQQQQQLQQQQQQRQKAALRRLEQAAPHDI